MCAASQSKSGSEPIMGASAATAVDLLLTDIDWLIVGDTSMTTITDGAIAIRCDRIARVGTTEALKAQVAAKNVLSLSGHLVLPGLVNTHTHGALSVFRGLADDLPLDRWLHEVIFPAEAQHMNAELVYLGTSLSTVEMLSHGITTCCDGYFFEESAARACADAGIRAVLGQGILDFPSPDQPDPSRARERVEAFADVLPGGTDRIRPSLFCHAPYTCGPDTLQWVKAFCRQRGWLFQIHLSETENEVVQLTEQFGLSPVFHLDRLGILDERTLCAHAVWLQQKEIERLAERGVAVSHNVQSNMKLASGTAPVPAMLDAGIPVGLGTDSCASNNSLDLFQEMDRTAKLYKVMTGDPTVCSAPTVLAMATSMGAKTLGLGKEIGAIETGKKADLIAINLNQPHLNPLYNPISHVVYSARGSDVRHAWVDGKQVVRDGRVQTIDTEELLKEVREIAKKLR